MLWLCCMHSAWLIAVRILATKACVLTERPATEAHRLRLMHSPRYPDTGYSCASIHAHDASLWTSEDPDALISVSLCEAHSRVCSHEVALQAFTFEFSLEPTIIEHHPVGDFPLYTCLMCPFPLENLSRSLQRNVFMTWCTVTVAEPLVKVERDGQCGTSNQMASPVARQHPRSTLRSDTSDEWR